MATSFPSGAGAAPSKNIITGSPQRFGKRYVQYVSSRTLTTVPFNLVPILSFVNIEFPVLYRMYIHRRYFGVATSDDVMQTSIWVNGVLVQDSQQSGIPANSGISQATSPTPFIGELIIPAGATVDLAALQVSAVATLYARVVFTGEICD